MYIMLHFQSYLKQNSVRFWPAVDTLLFLIIDLRDSFQLALYQSANANTAQKTTQEKH